MTKQGQPVDSSAKRIALLALSALIIALAIAIAAYAVGHSLCSRPATKRP